MANDWDEIRYFTEAEMACRCNCGFNVVDIKLMRILDAMRSDLGEAIKVTSGCRCVSHNDKVGGSIGSSHLPDVCQAADLYSPSSRTMFNLVTLAYKHGISRIGVAYDHNFVHVDVDQNKPQKLMWSY